MVRYRVTRRHSMAAKRSDAKAPFAIFFEDRVIST